MNFAAGHRCRAGENSPCKKILGVMVELSSRIDDIFSASSGNSVDVSPLQREAYVFGGALADAAVAASGDPGSL
jgi:hypothetical protein